MKATINTAESCSVNLRMGRKLGRIYAEILSWPLTTNDKPAALSSPKSITAGLPTEPVSSFENKEFSHD